MLICLVQLQCVGMILYGYCPDFFVINFGNFVIFAIFIADTRHLLPLSSEKMNLFSRSVSCMVCFFFGLYDWLLAC